MIGNETCKEHSGICAEVSGLKTAFNTEFAEFKKEVKNEFASLKEIITNQRIHVAVERVENKWKHRLTTIGFGAVGGGGAFGILDAISKYIIK